MTISLFSQLVRNVGGDLGPSGIQKRILETPSAELTSAQKVGLNLFWADVSSRLAASSNSVDPSTVMAVMACLPEVQDTTDFFFI